MLDSIVVPITLLVVVLFLKVMIATDCSSRMNALPICEIEVTLRQENTKLCLRIKSLEDQRESEEQGRIALGSELSALQHTSMDTIHNLHQQLEDQRESEEQGRIALASEISVLQHKLSTSIETIHNLRQQLEDQRASEEQGRIALVSEISVLQHEWSTSRETIHNLRQQLQQRENMLTLPRPHDSINQEIILTCTSLTPKLVRLNQNIVTLRSLPSKRTIEEIYPPSDCIIPPMAQKKYKSANGDDEASPSCGGYLK